MGNMKRHFKYKHPFIYAQENRKTFNTDEDEQTENQQSPWLLDDLGLLRERRKKKFYEHDTSTDKDADSKISRGAESNKKENRYRAWVRNYMVQVKIGVYECKICKRRLKVSSHSLVSLRRHCKTQHPNIYAQETANFKKSEEGKKQERKRDSIKGDVNLRKNTAKNNDKVEEDTDSTCCESDLETGVKSILLSDLHSIERKVHELYQIAAEEGKRNARPRSFYWKFFEMIKENSYKCMICEQNIAVSNTVGNLKRHIKGKHPEWSLLIQQYDSLNREQEFVDVRQEIPEVCQESEFEVVDNGYRCKTCDEVLPDTSESKLFDHIAENHPTQIVICSEESLPTDNDIGYNIVIGDDTNLDTVIIVPETN